MEQRDLGYNFNLHKLKIAQNTQYPLLITWFVKYTPVFDISHIIYSHLLNNDIFYLGKHFEQDRTSISCCHLHIVINKQMEIGPEITNTG